MTTARAIRLAPQDGRRATGPVWLVERDGIAGLLARWADRHRRRRSLAEIAALGERTMDDLGFDPDEVRAEAAKPFWRA